MIPSWKKKNGFLIFSIPVKLDTLTPTQSVNAHTKYILPLIFEPLVTINEKQEIQPVLAKSWLISPDKKSMIITIRPNHFFSDNTEVTAADIVNSIGRLCGPTSKAYEQLRGLNKCIEHAKGSKSEPEISAISRYQIKLSIHSNPTNFLHQLSSPNTVITKKTTRGLIGSGPYLLSEQKSDYIQLNTNRYYHTPGLIKNSGIIMFYANQAEVAKALTQDKIDGAIIYRIEDIWGFNDTNYLLIKSNPNIAELLVLNNQKFPLNKPIVRQALAAAIYNNFNHTCISGTRKAYGIIPNGIGGSINDKPPTFLPNILPQTLFKIIPQLKHTRVAITLHQLDDLKSECESKQLIQVAKQYNIDIQFKYHKNYPDLVKLYLNHQLDGFIELYVYTSPDAYSVLQFFTRSGENNANVNGNKIDSLLTAAIEASSSHGRYQAYKKLVKYMQNEGIIIPLFYMDHGTLLNKCLAGVSNDFFFSPFIYLPQIYKKQNCIN